MLNVVRVRIRARQYDGAVEVLRAVLASLAPGALQPVLAEQIRDIPKLATSQDPLSTTVHEIRTMADTSCAQ